MLLMLLLFGLRGLPRPRERFEFGPGFIDPNSLAPPWICPVPGTDAGFDTQTPYADRSAFRSCFAGIIEVRYPKAAPHTYHK